MKCDRCVHQSFEGATMECPYPSAWCGKGHWEGIVTTDEEPEIDVWENCEDFIEKSKGVIDV